MKKKFKKFLTMSNDNDIVYKLFQKNRLGTKINKKVLDNEVSW